MSQRRFQTTRMLAMLVCIAGLPAWAAESGVAQQSPTASQDSDTEARGTADIQLLPTLGGQIAKPKKSVRTAAALQPVTQQPTAQQPAPRKFRPADSPTQLRPATQLRPITQLRPTNRRAVTSQPVIKDSKPQPSVQFIENPFVRRATSGSTSQQKHRLTVANGSVANGTVANGTGKPAGPRLEYHQLPQKLRDSLETKIKERSAPQLAKPQLSKPQLAKPQPARPLFSKPLINPRLLSREIPPARNRLAQTPPARAPQIQLKRLASPRTAQLTDPFGDDPDQTPPPARPRPRRVDPVEPMDFAAGDAGEAVVEIVDSTRNLDVTVRRSKLLRTRFDIYRAAVVDTSVCDVVQFTPREVSIIGRGQGATNVTFWFEDGKHKPVTYLVRVVPDPEVQQRREEQYTILEDVLAEMFPDSKVHLIPVSDKLIVKGQAKGAAEAAQILAIIRGQSGVRTRNQNGNTVIDGRASDPIVTEASERRLPVSDVINMLRVPGVQQVALKVKIAELNRSAARGFGVDIDSIFKVGSGSLAIQSLLNFAAGGETATSILGSFDNGDIQFGLRYLQQKGIIRIISEPTLVTMSGRQANFIAGGEFAVPTTVGVGGASAVTTDFRAFGAIINFLPVVIDKDRIRLQVSPEFSKVNDDLSVNGTPGLDTRSVTTTVELREGQTLAIAGLLEDSMEGDITSDIPFIGKYLGRRDMKRNETELIIIVTPELVHPMDPEEVPPLPGFDVTEPTDAEFYLGGRLEGRPTVEHRSTVWPSLRRRYQAGGDSMISGPFGHGQ